MKVSLIIPTLNRKEELKNLLNSIKKNNYDNYEIIIVDQNEKGYLDSIVKESAKDIKCMKHLVVGFKGAAKARNYGVKYATGDIINFPDDDCEYTQDLLRNVVNLFDNKKYDAIFGVTIDKHSGEYSCLKFKDRETKVNYENMFSTTIEATMFIKTDVIKSVSGYDETLGVGTKFGADEGADLVLRLLYENYNLFFSPNLIFYHPNKEDGKNASVIKRGYSYGMGFGRLTAKHNYLYNYKNLKKRLLLSIIKCSIKIILGIFTLDTFNIKYNISIIKGRIEGYMLSKKEYKGR